MATSANYYDTDIELGDHLVVDETAKTDPAGDSENIQVTVLTGPQSLPRPLTDNELIGEEELVRRIHGIEKPVEGSGASEGSPEIRQNRSPSSVTTQSVHGRPLSKVPLDVTSKSEEDILKEFGDAKKDTWHNMCKIFWTYLNATVTLYIPGQEEPFICSGVLTDPQTWKQFLNAMNLSNKEHSCKPARSTLLLKIYELLTNTNQIQRFSHMSVQLTFRSPVGPVTVTVTGPVEEYSDKPNALYLLSPPIPTAVCEQLHTLYVKLCNVVRGMSKESMSMRSLFIVSLRDTGEKDLFPIKLILEELRLEKMALCRLMRVFEEKKEREDGSSDQILRINQGKQHAFIIQAGFVLSQF